ncbi:PspC domain-containing protein [Actinophytocola algeriensis]|uniref:Phage shock protein PspC (Stress-responsive transcriptional regulator) n=1 Tax=Actinophytocola algeriensis TaxID=1768010 RepID=A0A7W7QFC9_9PSEU|nr:PspC domain-containing protein [Actinophytocola algeriensis]MBB4912086.1 phage shock protein PspC (stress-responsive transcriptional regulator) [Actinophytocola algeriensis]MBE1477422.1 phage shock protein PspC (stress-responsive transcriptional regulator) [Actinophytocola algeriensis]
MSATQRPGGAMRAEDAVKDFWATRPRRPRRGRKIAGVSAGIANRYRIDPVLVRVGFVVATIYGGAGILFYLLGWLFLPEEDDEVSPAESLLGKGRSSTSSGFTILLGIVLVPVLGWFFGGSPIGTFPTWMSLVVIGGLLYLLHQSRGHLGPRPSAPQAETAMPTMPMTSAPMSMPMSMPPPMPTPPAAARADVPFTPLAGAPVDVTPPVDDRTTPPAWDPLGAAPFAWDLPEPAAPEPEEPSEPPVKKRRSRVGTMTVGLALVAAAGMAFAMGGWITPQHIVGVVLAILGLGMVAGAFVRGGRGLIALAVPLSVAGLALTVVTPGEYRGFGDLTAQPMALSQVEREYERSVGNVTVDLTQLPASSATADEVLEVKARTDIGNVEVIVPADADVVLTCETERGNASCLEASESGIESKIEDLESLGNDGPGGLRIELKVEANTGNVEVRRG